MEVVLYACACGMVATVLSQVRSQRETLKSVELERQLAAAHLQALQSQMEPHFLFNTLNTIASLVDLGRSHEASEMLSHLDVILRRTLDQRVPGKIPFHEELQVVEGYLAIQKMRFSDRLKVHIETSEDALQGLVPCFLLQPIVENAVQHGIAPMEKGGTIEARIVRSGDQLRMQVRDTGSTVQKSKPGHGIGLSSTRDRLAHFYPGVHHFSAGPLPTGGYEVTIEIPYEVATA
jgi:LytS/YehU family sensor histidine kinase